MANFNQKRKLLKLLGKLSPGDPALVDTVLSEVEKVKGTIPQPIPVQDFSPFYQKIQDLYSKLQSQEELSKEEKNTIEESLKSLEKDIKDNTETLRLEFNQRIAHLGGGSPNRKITISGTDPLTRYTDINYIGSGVTITTANDDTKKRVDMTFTATATSPASPSGSLQYNKNGVFGGVGSYSAITSTIDFEDNAILSDRGLVSSNGSGRFSALQFVNNSFTFTVSLSGDVVGNSFAKAGGTSSQFLKADGSVDSTAYITSSRTISTTAPLSGGGDLSADRTLTTSMSTNKLIGRGTASTGVMEEITLGTNLALSGTTLNGLAVAGSTGDIQVKSSGGILVNVAGMTVDTTGNARGTAALDIQTSRGAVTQVASGACSLALGQCNTASNTFASAFGKGNIASGSISTASGYGNTASGAQSAAIGVLNNASGNQSFGFGVQNSVSGYQASAVGFCNQVCCYSASGIGRGNFTHSDYASSMGYVNHACGCCSVAVGLCNIANACNASAFGSHVNNATADSTQIGPSNASKVTILSNGNVGIGTTAPGSPLNVCGANNVALFGNSVTPMASGTHTVDIIAAGAETPLALQGGSGAIEFWKDATPTKAIAFGMTKPGTAISDDFVVSAFNGSAWTEYLRLLNANGNLKIGSIISSYNGIATAGEGVPVIYGSGRSTAQTAAVASVATYTLPATDGSFEISANANITAFVAGTFNVQVDYTDETNTSRTLTLNFSSLTGTIGIALAAAGPFEGIASHIRCKASTAITVKTTGTFTSLTYNVEAIIRQLS